MDGLSKELPADHPEIQMGEHHVEFLDPKKAPVAGYGVVMELRQPIGGGKGGIALSYHLNIFEYDPNNTTEQEYQQLVRLNELSNRKAVFTVLGFGEDVHGERGIVRYNVKVDGKQGIYRDSHVYFSDKSILTFSDSRFDMIDPYAEYHRDPWNVDLSTHHKNAK